MSFHTEVSSLEGIEELYQTMEQQRSAVTLVPPAATCILLAGEKLYHLCKHGRMKVAEHSVWGDGHYGR